MFAPPQIIQRTLFYAGNEEEEVAQVRHFSETIKHRPIWAEELPKSTEVQKALGQITYVWTF